MGPALDWDLVLTLDSVLFALLMSFCLTLSIALDLKKFSTSGDSSTFAFKDCLISYHEFYCICIPNMLCAEELLWRILHLISTFNLLDPFIYVTRSSSPRWQLSFSWFIFLWCLYLFGSCYISILLGSCLSASTFSWFLCGKQRLAWFLCGKQRLSCFLCGKNRLAWFLCGNDRLVWFLCAKNRLAWFVCAKQRLTWFPCDREITEPPP